MDNESSTNIKQQITRLMPWLSAAKRKARIAISYMRLNNDGNTYAKTQQGAPLPHQLFSGSEGLYNEKTGFPMCYQHNKVHNLKVVARVLDGIVIKPGETFSFWALAHRADRSMKYKDGLVSVGGKLITAPGGGLCQMSNSLFWAFLHSPLDIVERHGHTRKDFPEPNSDSIKGVDATIAEGYKDLKVYNPTQYSYRLGIAFSESEITASITTDDLNAPAYDVCNGDIVYTRQGGDIWEYAPVFRSTTGADGQPLERELVYVNSCRIGYELPRSAHIIEEGQAWAIS